MYACFVVPVIDCTCMLHRHGWAMQPTTVTAKPTQFSERADSPVLFTGRWLEVTWPPLSFKLGRSFTTLSHQTLLSEDRQCWTSWRDAELGDRTVCAMRDHLVTHSEWEWVTEGYDWRSPGASLVSHSTVFFATLWHCRVLSDKWYADHIQFKYWLLRRLTPGTIDQSPPVLQRQ